ncbi:MAG: Crp/Fnr family transcriptional regulator [Rhodospirillales bacterium CG15_BIG_FIL_POST_REV_8_21_14_020_66_15]|nr:MAG: Crp/Fnr family transcriptional regulator [Rhodospirillales bacterium CG15_BIG_FIL_POST_REV_8_21_14_020_66_15]
MSDGSARSLAQVHLLQELSASEIARLEQACLWKTYAAQEQIIDRQSETRDVFFVVSGAVRVVIYSLSGREITLDDVNTGGHFGDLAAIDGEPRSASVMALTDTVIASLSQERFLLLLSEHFDVTLRVMRSLTRIVRTSTDRIMDLSTLAANNRVQADLLRLARNNMVGENRAELKPIPVHGDIASRVSTTRETVARVLSDLSRQGVVERQKDRLVIDDVDRLEDMVEEVRGE